MSPKEVLYIEDCLGHEKHMQTKCNDYVTKIQDPELQAFVQELAAKHKQLFDKIYNLL
jgi:hypothetical protein